MNFNLNHLEAFCILSDTLSFSKTATLLQTSQPAISLKIKMLEESLGYELFIRDKKNIALSKKGSLLKDKIYQSYLNMASVAPEKSKDNPLKIGSIYEAGEKILIPALTSLMKKNVLTSFHLILKSTDELTEKLLQGQLDFILVHQIPENKSIHSTAVFEDIPALIGGMKSSLKDLDSEESLSFITYREQDIFTDIFLKNHLSKSQVKKVQKSISLNSHRSMISLVNQLSTFAVIPRSSLSKASLQKVKILLEGRKSYNLYLCTRENFLSNKDNEKKFRSLTKEMGFVS